MGTTIRNILTDNRQCINKLTESTRGRANYNISVPLRNTDDNMKRITITPNQGVILYCILMVTIVLVLRGCDLM
jgi:hypothetical protein